MSEMAFFSSTHDDNLGVQGPPMLVWQMTRRHSSLLQDHSTVHVAEV